MYFVVTFKNKSVAQNRIDVTRYMVRSGYVKFRLEIVSFGKAFMKVLMRQNSIHSNHRGSAIGFYTKHVIPKRCSSLFYTG